MGSQAPNAFSPTMWPGCDLTEIPHLRQRETYNTPCSKGLMCIFPYLYGK